MASLELSDDELDRLAARLMERLEEMEARTAAAAAEARKQPDYVPPITDLTMHEMRVLEILVAGATSEEAGAVLGVKGRTVDTHRWHAGKKLGSRSLVHLGWLAAKLGIEPRSFVPLAKEAKKPPKPRGAGRQIGRDL